MVRNLRKSQSLNLFPDRLFYKIGEVSKILEVEPYVLRYWESEFAFLRPKRSPSGQRIYMKQDVDLLLTIKRLLYDEKYTIDGVRKKLQRGDNSMNQTPSSGENTAPLESRSEDLLNYIKNRLRDISRSL